MEGRDGGLLPAQQFCPLLQPLPGISMYFWLSRRAAERLQQWCPAVRSALPTASWEVQRPCCAGV